MDYERLDFSYNWNNGKLDNKIFTTIRLHNPKKYCAGKKFRVFLKKIHRKDVEVIEIKVINISQINAFIAGIDTGYDEKICKELIKTMYPKCDFDNEEKPQLLYFILLKTIERKSLI